MSQVPARLVYTDSNGDQQVIGSFQPSNPTTGNISTFTIDEDAKNYKRVIIEGAPELNDKLPTSTSEFQGDEPVIIAQEDADNDGNWSDRVRVYPEEGGTTNNRGRYKNKELWGFKRFYGEDDVKVTSETNGPITTNLKDVLDALLPNGYTARYPSDRTPPNVNEYTFNGSRQKAFNEIRKQYEHFIIFTSETDGSENIYVDLQPKGYGDTQFSLVRGQDAYTYNNWKKSDTSNIISKVKVIGKDTDNNKIERVVAAGSSTGVHGDEDVDVYLGSPEPDRKKFKSIHVDYTITDSEADDIAEKIIEPTATEHGEIEASLNIESTLNQSVGINDDRRTPNNPIDDVFTVVRQKDFIHQGSTLYSFEFESEASQEQVDKWREHDSERAKLYPGGQENVGEQDFTGDTGSAPSDTQRDPSTGLDGDKQGENITSARQTVKDGEGTSFIGLSAEAPASFAANTSQPGGTVVVQEGITINISITNFAGEDISNAEYTVTNQTTDITLLNDSTRVDNQSSVNIQAGFDSSLVSPGDVILVELDTGGTVGADFESGTGEIFFSTVSITLSSNSQHLVGEDIDTEDFDHGGTSEAQQHGTSGSTDEKNVNISTEDDTSR